jgi:hypothetical protein
MRQYTSGLSNAFHSLVAISWNGYFSTSLSIVAIDMVVASDRCAYIFRLETVNLG